MTRVFILLLLKHFIVMMLSLSSLLVFADFDKVQYYLEQRMRIMANYCQNDYQVSLSPRSEVSNAGEYKEFLYVLRRFRRDQIFFLSNYPFALESGYVINDIPFHQIYDECDTKMEKLNDKVLVIEVLHEIIFMCMSADLLNDVEATPAYLKQLETVSLGIITNFSVIKSKEPNLDYRDISYLLWGEPFNEMFRHCQKDMREAIHAKAPELHNLIFH